MGMRGAQNVSKDLFHIRIEKEPTINDEDGPLNAMDHCELPPISINH